MSMKGGSDRYGAMAVSVHWLSAVLIFALVVSGFRAAGAVDPAVKAQLLRIHVPVATAVLLLTLLRVVWWLAVDRRPDPVAGSPRWQERSAKAVHALFYVVIIGMIASGIGMMVISGAGPIIFGQGGALPDFSNVAPRLPHGIGARLFVALIVLHVGAALYHHFVLRDGLIWRMWFGKSL